MFDPYPGSLMLIHLGKIQLPWKGGRGSLVQIRRNERKLIQALKANCEMRVIATCYLIVKQFRSHGQLRNANKHNAKRQDSNTNVCS